MNRAIEERKWRRASKKPEITGWEFAIRAEAVADFIASMNEPDYDTFCTDSFDGYIEKMARAFKFNFHPENFSLLTNLDLHNITCGSMDLREFLDYLEDRNINELRSALYA